MVVGGEECWAHAVRVGDHNGGASAKDDGVYGAMFSDALVRGATDVQSVSTRPRRVRWLRGVRGTRGRVGLRGL